MKILLGKDIRSADLRTIEREPVAGIDLMERAAVALETEAVAAAEAPVTGDMTGLPFRENAHEPEGRVPE